jgi:hypothetical protein
VPIGTARNDVISAGHRVDQDKATGPIGEKPNRAHPVALLGRIDAAAQLSRIAT